MIVVVSFYPGDSDTPEVSFFRDDRSDKIEQAADLAWFMAKTFAQTGREALIYEIKDVHELPTQVYPIDERLTI